MQEYQEIDLLKIKQNGVSNNLVDMSGFEYFKNSTWHTVKPGTTLYELTSMGFQVRQKKVA